MKAGEWDTAVEGGGGSDCVRPEREKGGRKSGDGSGKHSRVGEKEGRKMGQRD